MPTDIAQRFASVVPQSAAVAQQADALADPVAREHALRLDPLTGGTLDDPVVAPDGRTYSRAPLELFMKETGANPWNFDPANPEELFADQSMRDRLDQAEAEVVKDDEPEHLVDAITQDLLDDPVTASDGRTYNFAELQQWYLEKGTSPFTREPLKADVYRNQAAAADLKSRGAVLKDYAKTRLSLNKDETGNGRSANLGRAVIRGMKRGMMGGGTGGAVAGAMVLGPLGFMPGIGAGAFVGGVGGALGAVASHGAKRAGHALKKKVAKRKAKKGRKARQAKVDAFLAEHPDFRLPSNA